ncbi:ATP-dependent DNA helicase MER3 [Linderina pennispora]|nr:ATP-dependent DNA helicase MER3 [Linderina pennispora]
MHGTDDNDLCADGFDDVLTFFSGISSTASDSSNHQSAHWPQDKAVAAATSPYFQKKRPAVSARPPMAITLKRPKVERLGAGSPAKPCLHPIEAPRSITLKQSKTGSPPSEVPAWPGQVPVTALPAKFAVAYAEFTHFNRMQSECFAHIFNSDINLVVSAPTASGKTLLMEIAIARLFGSQSSKSIDKVLYLAPLRALCMERSSEWTKRFQVSGLKSISLVGGGDDSDEDSFSSSRVVLGFKPDVSYYSDRARLEQLFKSGSIRILYLVTGQEVLESK